MLTLKPYVPIAKLLLATVSVLWLAGCGGSAEEEELPGDLIHSEKAPVASEPDTTLQKVTNLTLKATGENLEEMRFDLDTLEVKANALVKLVLINEGKEPSMVHNVVFTRPNKYKMVALAGAEAGAPGNYVPEGDAVIAASPLALPGQQVEVEFTAPAELGSYDFVCTYPGHWKRMHGVLLVK